MKLPERLKKVFGIPDVKPPGSSPMSGEQVRNARTPIKHHSAADVAHYYNEWTERYLQGFGEVFQGARPDSTEELLNYIMSSARIENGQRILDAGCGVCGPAIWFAEHFDVRIDAITISEVQVAEATKRIQEKGLQDRITVRQGDFHRLSEYYPPDTFDRVLFLETLCHAEDYRPVLTEARTVLKPYGFLYIKDYYCVDYRAWPEMRAQQQPDLEELNRLYCLVMPDLPSIVDVISELGFDLVCMRHPTYTYSPAIWENFMRKSNQFWLPKMDPVRVIKTMEFLAMREPFAR
ncbi:SAM-dependent methyltransferase [Methylomagnum ishizawai]|uniref:SAM-dependent methyltransferase n=1 Tax=Methylomagnum ishizawai TaxID=1760988 RepID=UPI001C32697C|nr:class I SAM-dependent methyltransferase [Methylomagnum ishizawai]BBL77184.1 hypothetical protein MishRS11D_42820 [Methylomagnum ishizawai]